MPEIFFRTPKVFRTRFRSLFFARLPARILAARGGRCSACHAIARRATADRVCQYTPSPPPVAKRKIHPRSGQKRVVGSDRSDRSDPPSRQRRYGGQAGPTGLPRRSLGEGGSDAGSVPHAVVCAERGRGDRRSRGCRLTFRQKAVYYRQGRLSAGMRRYEPPVSYWNGDSLPTCYHLCFSMMPRQGVGIAKGCEMKVAKRHGKILTYISFRRRKISSGESK